MRDLDFGETLQVFTTCPQSKDFPPADYVARVAEIAAWSDEASASGMLIYTDNGLVDPWLLADHVLRVTRALCPLVAVQPVYMHPYTAAKMVATAGFLHGRRLWLNMLAGGFKNDLAALGDRTPHDDRYVRTVEYARIMRLLLAGETVVCEGRYYAVQGLRLAPPLPEALAPGWLISGSSEAGRAAAREIGAVAVEYPPPPDQIANRRATEWPSGFRIGIIARDDAETAWREAWARFPQDRRGQMAHALAMRTSDSAWHSQLSRLAREHAASGSPYWLWPFENYQTFCPYLVGDFETVAREVSHYLALGFRSLILDIPREAADLRTTGMALRRALKLIGG